MVAGQLRWHGAGPGVSSGVTFRVAPPLVLPAGRAAGDWRECGWGPKGRGLTVGAVCFTLSRRGGLGGVCGGGGVGLNHGGERRGRCAAAQGIGVWATGSCGEERRPGQHHPLPHLWGSVSHGRAVVEAVLPSLSLCLSPSHGPSVQEDWDEEALAVARAGLSLTLWRGVGTITWRPLPLMPSRWKMGVLGMLGLCTMEKREGEGEGAREFTALEQREVLMSKECSRSSSSSWSGPPWTTPTPPWTPATPAGSRARGGHL